MSDREAWGLANRHVTGWNTVRRARCHISIPVSSELGDFFGGVTQADMQGDTGLRPVSGDQEPEWECVGCKAWGLLSLNLGDSSAPRRLGS